MKSPTEIHSDSAIELQVYHLIKCYHNFCIMSLLSKQQSFPLQVKRICRDSSFVTLMSFSAKLSSQIFLSLFRIPRQNSQLFSRPFTYCEAIRHVISVESWQVESWPSNHVWKSGCIHSNEISCNRILERGNAWPAWTVTLVLGDVTLGKRVILTKVRECRWDQSRVIKALSLA